MQSSVNRFKTEFMGTASLELSYCFTSMEAERSFIKLCEGSLLKVCMYLKAEKMADLLNISALASSFLLQITVHLEI